MNTPFFPFSEYWWFYLVFTGIVGILLTIDLLSHRNAGAIPMRAAAVWTGIWVALALAFASGLYLFAGSRFDDASARRLTLEFLAGYLVEESLSIDNMFVFALIFRHFGIPQHLQHRVLFFGVAGAMVFRAIFIALGAALIRFEVVMILFGVFLLVTAWRLAFSPEREPDLGQSLVVRWARRVLPVSSSLAGSRFTVRLDGRWHATPLLIVLLLLETTDILFAVDSVPAVFGVTREPLIVYTSNVFAVLGLRAMYFLLAGALDRFHALKYGLAGVLAFVGLKLIWLDRAFGGHFPTGLSLGIIAVLLGASVLWSVRIPGVMWMAAGCVALGAFCLTAVGLGRGWRILEAADSLGPEWFVISGVAWLAAGWALAATRHRR
jgi:tellurite resistance protein TerC